MKALDEARRDLQRITGMVTVGTQDRPRTVRRIDLAFERIAAWHADTAVNLARSPRRGGTRAVVEQDEHEADYTLSKRAEYDAAQLARLLAGVAAICARYTIPINTDGMSLDPPPGCRSCARNRKLGDTTLPGFWNPIDQRYQNRRLCRWCGDHHASTGRIPPLEAVEIYHRQTPAAAGRWLAKHGPRPGRGRKR